MKAGIMAPPSPYLYCSLGENLRRIKDTYKCTITMFLFKVKIYGAKEEVAAYRGSS